MLGFRSYKSFFFVLVQFATICFLSVTGNIFPRNFFLLVTIILTSVPGLWGILLMNRHINVAPDPLKDSVMITNGPYKFIRHPMYFSLLSVTLIWIIDFFTFIRFFIWILLLVDILSKLRYEENLLLKSFSGYRIRLCTDLSALIRFNRISGLLALYLKFYPV